MGLFFGERIGARLWWAIGAVIIGLAVVAQVWDSHLRPLGVVAGLAAAVPFAFYFLASERGVAQRHPLAVSLKHVVLPLWVPLLWMVTLGGFAPFVLLFMALRHASATAVGVAASSEVLFAFAVAWVWLGETPTVLQIAGAAVVFTGIVVAQTARHSATAALEPPALGEVPQQTM